jgi:hypothetical protein
MMRRALLLSLLLLMVVLVPENTANPGGEGDSNRDFACGGACHGDPGLSGPSSAVLTISADRSETYVGGPLTVTVSAHGMELSARKLVGIFLLTGTHGVDDTPQAAGWTIASDGEGGAGNYVEARVINSAGVATAQWSLRAPQIEGDYRLITSIHHGGDGVARLALDEVGILISVGPVPENQPQISAGWAPPTNTQVGETVRISVPAVNATSASLEWKTTDGTAGSLPLIASEDDWSGSLPTPLSPTEIQYRVVLKNDEFEENSAWFTLSFEAPEALPNDWAFRLQAIAILFTALALCITLNRRLGRKAGIGKSGAVEVFGDLASMPMGEAQEVVASLDLTDLRRPVGWSDEQWVHYGEEYLRNIGGDV